MLCSGIEIKLEKKDDCILKVIDYMARVKQKLAPSRKIREAQIIVSRKALYQLKLEGEIAYCFFFHSCSADISRPQIPLK